MVTRTESPDGRQVLDEGASFIITDILADRGARSLTFGLENALATPFWSAVKTGTSKDMRDNWCIGFSERYTVGVWVGNFDGSPMQDVSGVTGAAPVWLDLMRYLHGQTPSRPPRASSSVVQTEVRFTPAFETNPSMSVRFRLAPPSADVSSEPRKKRGLRRRCVRRILRTILDPTIGQLNGDIMHHDKKIADDVHALPRKRGGGILRREVWVDGQGRVVRYNLAYINRELHQGDYGRVLGYDNRHGYHHRHYFGEVSAMAFESFESAEERLQAEWHELLRSRNT